MKETLLMKVNPKTLGYPEYLYLIDSLIPRSEWSAAALLENIHTLYRPHL